MNREEILFTIKQVMPHLKEKFGAEQIALFGSYARNQAQPDSDIDLLVTLPSADLNQLVALSLFLEKQLNHKVDLVRQGKHLSKRFVEATQSDLIYA